MTQSDEAKEDFRPTAVLEHWKQYAQEDDNTAGLMRSIEFVRLHLFFMGQFCCRPLLSNINATGNVVRSFRLDRTCIQPRRFGS